MVGQKEVTHPVRQQAGRGKYAAAVSAGKWQAVWGCGGGHGGSVCKRVEKLGRQQTAHPGNWEGKGVGARQAGKGKVRQVGC